MGRGNSRPFSFMITLGQLKTHFAGFAANQNISAKISDWAYWVVSNILATPQKFWWNKKKTSLTTVASTPEYFLDPRINGRDILWMGDESRQGFEICEKPLEEIYRYDSTPTDEGNPTFWALVNQAEVQDLNTATTSSAVSTDGSDLSGTVLIRGKVSGKDRFETISLNGTTPATPSSPLTWDADSITSVSLSDAPVGAITVTVGNVVAVIPPGHQRIQAPRIRLWRIPGDVLTLPYIFYQKPLRMVADSDILQIPEAGFDCVLKGMLYWAYLNNGDVDFAQAKWGEFLQAKKDFISWSQNELNKKQEKSWPRDRKDIPFRLPRTINATVT